MKKFLVRALPLCLALLIFVSSLAVPAFASTAKDVELSGCYEFKFDAPVFPIEDLTYGNFVFDGSSYERLLVFGRLIEFGFKDDAGGWSRVVVRDSDGEWISSVRRFEVLGTTYCSQALLSWLTSATYSFPPVLTSDNGDSIFSVFSGISGWIVSSIGTIMPMFYAEATGLTFIGTLAVAALALGVCFLIFALIRRFLNFG